ncbi:MAG: sulfatase-like hydrolase/transferase [Roseomonas sp.]|nr:sulfatase-like hydrolase/transferase [Roseomonas sp.]MCA3381293.1 sulfatase-like hydrolase/transferase [Roseomonas sp.]
MAALTHALISALLPLPIWLWLRWQVAARFSAWVALDATPWLAGYLLLLGMTARPLLSGGAVAGALIFIGIAQFAKRATLRDGLVFTDGGLLWQVFAHPRFYLPFVPRPVLALGIASGMALTAFVLALEPGLDLGAIARMLILLLGGAMLLVTLRPLFLLGRTPLQRDPATDAARFGPLACFAFHARLAAIERAARQARHAPVPAALGLADPAPHLLLLQLESFCDPRRFGLAQALPHKDRLAEAALTQGSLAVAAFGANTMRTEFAVLTGLDDAALGLDRFNPYFRLARKPIQSLAWALRGAGYGTLCLHPFDRRFFGRDKVLPALGFARFDAAAAFQQAERARGLVSDAAIAERLAADLATATSPGFWYVISVAAHGPWQGDDPAGAWTACMKATDDMLGTVMRAAQGSARPVVIAAFGDHRPALAEAKGGTETDYLIWRSDRPGTGRAERLDAIGLHHAIMGAMQG